MKNSGSVLSFRKEYIPRVFMMEILSRSLRVRDDGTGKRREEKATFAEFENEEAIVLLGDPGMGKTTFFLHAAKSNYTTVRNFLINHSIRGSDPLFLDALDEYRIIANGQDASSEVAKELCTLKKPKFRLSCRAADWFGSTDQEVLRIASSSGRVVVLELCPLSRDEILKAVKGLIPDPAAFLDEAHSAGLGNLLGNPQTLELLARAWGTDKKPRNKFEAYEIGVSELLKEINPQHVVRGVSSPDLNNLRKAAGAAASILLLSNSIGITRTEPADTIGYVRLTVVPHPNRSDLEFVLKRHLFVSAEVDRFHLNHRTIAEFLAAEDLSKRIMNGLPIDRVMALICGIDGRPISSLRGLFAWLMCRCGHIAEDYVDRDPYGVVTYGDASVLPPSAQREIWVSLSKLRDPWFLTNKGDRGSFRELANLNTVDILQGLLNDPITGVHLKIAVLEAIANSTETWKLSALLKSIVLEKNDNTGLRSTALKAYAKSIKNDSVQLKVLDDELARAADDPAAPEIRVDLLLLTQASGSLGLQILSILEQAANFDDEEQPLGRFYPLIGLPSDSDLDVILNGAGPVKPKDVLHWEFSNLFEDWFKRRLEGSAPITPFQLAGWLRNLPLCRNQYSEKTLGSFKARFEQEPTLFERVFELLSSTMPNEEHSFWLFVSLDVWEMLPPNVWPVPQCEFFLEHAKNEKDPERAADFFRMYLSLFPTKGASVTLGEEGFALMERRTEVAQMLGNWKSCKIQKWREDQWKRNEKERRKRLANRKQNVVYLAPRLTTIREGREEHALAWAAQIYLGLFYDIKNIPDARERLVSKTNEEIADAFICGFFRYAESPNIPKKDAIIENWLKGRISSGPHFLLGLSVFLRHSSGMNIPEESLPNCIGVVAISLGFHNEVPGYDETLASWMLQEIRRNPTVVKSVLREMWILGAEKNGGELPGFYQISQDAESQRFIASLSADVLKAGINKNHIIVDKLVSVLLFHDQRTALSIGETELARNELSAKVRTIWSTALFVIDPGKYLDPWRTLMSGEDAALWNAIGLIRGARHEMRGDIMLTTAQRAEVVALIGKRFPNVDHPSRGWNGSQNPWDASEFIADQIRLIAADCSAEAGIQLERLEKDGSLASYHDLIRHHRAQYEKQQRESTFSFASPKKVAEAISNQAPATPNDLLSYIVDHLGALSREIARTQRERYRAYWNESGHNLTKPKHEEVCSGLLAEDLQNRVQAHSLIVTVEHHMIADKECDLVILLGTERLLPIEVKHHYNAELWTAWRTQLDRLYTRDAKAVGLGIYLILWSGETRGRMMPRIPNGLKRPSNAIGLCRALESLIPEEDRYRLRIVVVDISKP